MNTRRYPRTMQQAFGWYTDDKLHPMPERSRLREFFTVYREYRHSHPKLYAARIAYQIAFKRFPF